MAGFSLILAAFLALLFLVGLGLLLYGVLRKQKPRRMPLILGGVLCMLPLALVSLFGLLISSM